MLLTLTLASLTAAAGAEPLTITGAWVRATPPGARTAAAYLTIMNEGPADRLLGATTPAAREVQLHTHVSEGGMQHMVQVPEIALPLGEEVRLEPGGLHLMLIDIATPLTAGGEITLVLRFATAAAIEIAVPIVDARAMAAPAHDGR
jgi:hypothetical protein